MIEAMTHAVLTSVRLIQYPACIACTMNYHTSIIIVLRLLFVNVGPNIAAIWTLPQSSNQLT